MTKYRRVIPENRGNGFPSYIPDSQPTMLSIIPHLLDGGTIINQILEQSRNVIEWRYE
jgi:hypothetical protein